MLTTLLAFLVALGVLVTFHEFGHYWVARRGKPDSLPWQANFIGLNRLKDWLQLLSLEPAGGAFLCYAPPFERESWLQRWRFMEDAGDRWWPLAAGVYAIEAVKRVRGMRLLTPRWRPVCLVQGPNRSRLRRPPRAPHLWLRAPRAHGQRQDGVLRARPHELERGGPQNHHAAGGGYGVYASLRVQRSSRRIFTITPGWQTRLLRRETVLVPTPGSPTPTA